MHITLPLATKPFLTKIAETLFPMGAKNTISLNLQIGALFRESALVGKKALDFCPRN